MYLIICSYQVAAQKRQSLLRDQPQSPLERAIFWTEYVIRNKDVSHLKLGSEDLNLLQRNLIDVYLVIFATVFLLLSLLITFCVLTVKYFPRFSLFVVANLFLVICAIAYHFFSAE